MSELELFAVDYNENVNLITLRTQDMQSGLVQMSFEPSSDMHPVSDMRPNESPTQRLSRIIYMY